MPTDKDELIEFLKQTNREQKETIADLRSTIKELHATIANLNESLDELKRRFYGTSSEKTASETVSSGEEKTSEVAAHTRTRKKK